MLESFIEKLFSSLHLQRLVIRSRLILFFRLVRVVNQRPDESTRPGCVAGSHCSDCTQLAVQCAIMDERWSWLNIDSPSATTHYTRALCDAAAYFSGRPTTPLALAIPSPSLSHSQCSIPRFLQKQSASLIITTGNQSQRKTAASVFDRPSRQSTDNGGSCRARLGCLIDLVEYRQD